MPYLVFGLEAAIIFTYNQIFGISEYFVYIVVAVNCIIIPLLFLRKERDGLIWFIMSAGFLVRAFWLILRLELPGVPEFLIIRVADSGGFHEAARLAVENGLILRPDVYGGIYTKAISIWYYIFGINFTLAEFTNVILYAVSLSVFVDFLYTQQISRKGKILAVSLYSFLPWAILISICLLREQAMVCLLILSLNCFTQWMSNGRVRDLVPAVVFSLFAAAIHSGMIVIFALYLIYIAFYSTRKGRIQVNTSRVIILVALGLLGGILIIASGTTFIAYFRGITTSGWESLFYTLNYSAGGSAYLSTIKVNSMTDLIWYMPLKVFNFLFAPMLWQIRGLADIIFLLLDVLIYTSLMIGIIKNYHKGYYGKTNLFILCFISLIIMYAMGTFTWGTAMRHRFKSFIPLTLAYIGSAPQHSISSISTRIRKTARKGA